LDIGSAVNAGLTASRSDVVAFIDDDAEARPDWVELLETTFADPKVGAVGGRDELHLDGVLIPSRPKAHVGRISWYGRVIGNHHLGDGPRREVDVLKGCNMAVRRRLVNGVSPALLGPYTYRWEDDLCAQVRRQRATVIYDPKIRVVHMAARPLNARVEVSSAGAFISAHNLAFVQFRYLSGWRRVAWLVFSLLAGQPDDPGIIRVVPMRARWLTAFKGKLAGIRSATRALREEAR
jgi:cellulose synthase/poly-beta-1,6-N-acetylglucosamine synthase-like glycosyltransferase